MSLMKLNIINLMKNEIYENKWQPSYKISNEYIYEQLEDFYGEENIPDDLLESFKNGTLKNIGYNYITENLKKHAIHFEEVSEYFDKCHRQAYHFTYKKNVESILKNGLRLRHGNYRDFPERIYLWASDHKQEINDNNKELLEFIHKIFGDDKLSLKDIGIIKVDLYHTDFPVYKDTAMKQKEAIFVYNSIPSNLCKEIKL